MNRYAFVKGADSEKHLNAYLDGTDYKVVDRIDDKFIIAGKDVAGWTLDDYVIPRLASGLIWAEEITEDNPVEERNQAIIWYEDSIVHATVVDMDTVTFRTIDGFEPKVNRIGLEFRLHMTFNRKLQKWQMANVYAYRTDQTGFRQPPATDNQKSKLYRFFLDTVLNGDRIPARVLNAGAVNGIELAIVAETNEIERLKIRIAEHQEKIRALELQLEAELVR